jgi:hypothetical protein
LGTFFRAFTFGHVRQLDAIAARFLVALAGVAPGLVAGAEAVAYVDIDDTVRATHGSAKQGAGYGYSRVKGLNLLLATLCTPTAAPLILATRLRAGATNSARGAARLVTDALTTARRAGVGGLLTLRSDSAYYGAAVVAAARRAGARFSITARMDPAIKRAIGSIGEDAWTPGRRSIKYPSGLGRRRGPLGLRRPGRLHRVHVPPQGRARHRPVDRAPRQTPQPRHLAARAG